MLINQKKKTIIEVYARSYELKGFAKKMLSICMPRGLLPESRYCIWLEGPLGAGKTTLCTYLFRELGLPGHIPVTSPTYACLNEYQIGRFTIAHLDLYRLGKDTEPEELGLSLDHEYAALFLEWPRNISDRSLIEPDFILEIELRKGAGDDGRLYRLVKISG